MPKILANGINIYYEEAGAGTPVVFLHESAGDYRSWEHQMRFLGGRHRCITYSARGYNPSDVPTEVSEYSQTIVMNDVLGLMDALGVDKAHLCGCSMGSYTALSLALAHPERALSVTMVGTGHGSGMRREEFHEWIDGYAPQYLERGMAAMAEDVANSAERVQMRNNNPREWAEFKANLSEHSPVGKANTYLGVMRTRPSIMDLEDELRRTDVPLLVMIGDEDYPGIEASCFLKRVVQRSGMEMYPRSGHAINLELPHRFNRSLLDFVSAVDAGRWGPQDPVTLAFKMGG